MPDPVHHLMFHSIDIAILAGPAVLAPLIVRGVVGLLGRGVRPAAPPSVAAAPAAVLEPPVVTRAEQPAPASLVACRRRAPPRRPRLTQGLSGSRSATVKPYRYANTGSHELEHRVG